MSYGELCSTYTCNPNLGLTCGGTGCICPKTQLGSVCDCPLSKYWTGSTCAARVGYLGDCTATYMCYYSVGLICPIDKCICYSVNTYWNPPTNQCGIMFIFAQLIILL